MSGFFFYLNNFYDIVELKSGQGKRWVKENF